LVVYTLKWGLSWQLSLRSNNHSNTLKIGGIWNCSHSTSYSKLFGRVVNLTQSKGGLDKPGQRLDEPDGPSGPDDPNKLGGPYDLHRLGGHDDPSRSGRPDDLYNHVGPDDPNVWSRSNDTDIPGCLMTQMGREGSTT